jgi:divalent metal cation (Fe/Co/Zn/Cd) transporter
VSKKNGNKKKPPANSKKAIRVVAAESEGSSLREDFQDARKFLKESWQNRPGVIGFWLSIGQLIGHSIWVSLIWYLSSTGQAAYLTSDSWMSWLVVGVLGLSLMLTFASMFVCLYYGLRRAPRLFPLIGFAISFFVGVLATSLVFMQAIRSMSAK